MRVGLVSWGGCGTWMLENVLENAGLRVDATHSRDPSCFKEGKVIYIYGNPLDSVLSFKRRNDESFNNFWFTSHIENLGLSGTATWQTIIDGDDPFGLKDHFDSWYNYDERTYDIVFIKYEDLTEHVDDLAEWLGLEGLDIHFRQRQSSFEAVDSRTQNALMDVYGDIYETWRTMKSVEVK
jgi:hypothetical protein